MFGVAIGTMALIVVLSVFNGLGDVLKSVYNTYDADFKIVPKTGKSFNLSDAELQKITELEGVSSYSRVIEDNAVAIHRGKQAVVELRGIEKTFLRTNKLDTFLLKGELKVEEKGRFSAILGLGLYYELGALIETGAYEIELIYPRDVRPGSVITPNSFRRIRLKPSAVISIDAALDEKLMITSYNAVSELLGYDNRYTAFEIYLDKDAPYSRVKSSLNDILGDEYDILDSDEQHSDIMNAVKIEKLFAYIALSFITLIASFNIFFSLSMLAIEKRRDMSVLFAVGASEQLVRAIFFKQGTLIAIVGAIVGVGLGLTFCFLQDQYGLIGLGMSNAVVQSYPVKVVWTDVALVSISICIITIVTSYRPAKLAAKINPIEFLD